MGELWRGNRPSSENVGSLALHLVQVTMKNCLYPSYSSGKRCGGNFDTRCTATSPPPKQRLRRCTADPLGEARSLEASAKKADPRRSIITNSAISFCELRTRPRKVPINHPLRPGRKGPPTSPTKGFVELYWQTVAL